MKRALLRAGTVIGLLLTAMSPAKALETAATASATEDSQEAPSSKGKPAPNSVYIEGLGSGLFYSVNYERRVIDDLGVRAGLSYMSISSSASTGSATATASSTYLTVPLTVSYLGVRGRRSGLEVGGGLTLAYSSGSASTGVSSASGSGMTPFGTLMVGYRLHPVDHAGFQFRVGVMALAAKGLSFDPDPNKFGVLPWFYMSCGAGF
ncbi:MAG: hypothetical protein QM778_17690 [Myxococcales bacterium]